MNKREELGIELFGNDKLFDEIISENMNDRKIVINNEITKSAIEEVCLWLLKWAKEDKGKPVEMRKRITIYMASYGGIVSTGYSIIDIIESIKTPVDCIMLDVSYSMGGLIPLACDRRIAFKNSTVLLHDGSTGGYGSTAKMRDIAKFTEEQESRIKEFILNNTNIDDELYESKYGSEWYMYADEAKERGIVTHIIGEDIDLEEVL